MPRLSRINGYSHNTVPSHSPDKNVVESCFGTREDLVGQLRPLHKLMVVQYFFAEISNLSKKIQKLATHSTI